MLRDARGSKAYWDKWVAFFEETIAEDQDKSRRPTGNPGYMPQYIYDLAKRYLYLTLDRYSRGDPVNDLPQYFDGLLDAWEESERLGKGTWSKEEERLRRDWTINLNFYMDCFWLIGLALTLNIPDNQWLRLLALVDNEGRDALLDRVIASRQPARKVGEVLCYPKAYRDLQRVIDAPADQRPTLLKDYLDGWYASLENAGSSMAEPFLRTPYWYTSGDENFEGGAYFGRWCVEAAAVAKAFGIDDSLCLGHPNYPGDLLRDGRSPRHADTASAFHQVSRARSARSWIGRLFRM